MSDEMQEDGEINYARSIFASMGETYSSRCPARPRQWRLSPDLVQRPHHRLLRTRAEPGASGRVADHGHRVEWPASDHRISVSLSAHAASDIPTRVNPTCCC